MIIELNLKTEISLDSDANKKYPNRSGFRINKTPPSGSDPSGNQQEAGTTTKPNL
jgi:hypothetical protein